MKNRNVLVSALFAAGIMGAVAAPLPSMAAVDVYANTGPPPDRHEVVPGPRHGYVWSPGYWDWRGNRHVWMKGRSVRERSGYAYEPHRWVESDGRWNLQRARWNQTRNRDSDGDGIPNRRDPTPHGGNRPGDRDGDGVPNRYDARPNNPDRR